MFCGEEERVPDSVSGATDGESQDDFDLMESDCDEDYSELSAFCMWYISYDSYLICCISYVHRFSEQITVPKLQWIKLNNVRYSQIKMT